MNTTVEQYQLWQDETSWYQHSGKRDGLELAYLALGLGGESGEFEDAVKKLLRRDGMDAVTEASPQEIGNLLNELGDAQWYVVRACTMFGITLEELMILNMWKLYNRLHTRTEHNLKQISWPFGQANKFAMATKVDRIFQKALTTLGIEE